MDSCGVFPPAEEVLRSVWWENMVLPNGIISSFFQEKILKFVEHVDTIMKKNVYAVID